MTDDPNDTSYGGLLDLLHIARLESSDTELEEELPPMESEEDVFAPEFLAELRTRRAESPETLPELFEGPWTVFQRFNEEEGETWVVIRASEDPLTARPAAVFQHRRRAHLLAAFLSVSNQVPELKLEEEGDGYAVLEREPGGEWEHLAHLQTPDTGFLHFLRLLRGLQRSPDSVAQMIEAARGRGSTLARRSLEDDLEKPS
jgi:hypothetical protein